jgi:hypothetical protein
MDDHRSVNEVAMMEYDSEGEKQDSAAMGEDHNDGYSLEEQNSPSAIIARRKEHLLSNVVTVIKNLSEAVGKVAEWLGRFSTSVMSHCTVEEKKIHVVSAMGRGMEHQRRMFLESVEVMNRLLLQAQIDESGTEGLM